MSIKINGKYLSQILFSRRKTSPREIGYNKFHNSKMIGIRNICFDKTLPSYNTLDIYMSKDNGQKSTLVFINIDETSNSKNKRRGLARYIASLQYNVISITCGQVFPENVTSCISALQWAYKHKERYSFNLDKIVIAGDSIGAFAAFCVATAITDSSYALKLNVKIPDVKVIAEAYFCGLYDIPTLMSTNNSKSDANTIVKKLLGKKIKHISDFQKSNHLDTLSPIKFFAESRGPIFVTHTDFDNLFSQHGTKLIHMLVKLGSPYLEIRAIKAKLNHNWQLDINNKFGMLVIDIFSEFLISMHNNRDSFVSRYIDI
ncbi:MAG: alpha/beta hydrolase [Christensenellaceae bacterium]|jgi:hypothetical protein|nr:alpha/beta hydrolase [Christensenellaceae bacterium]